MYRRDCAISRTFSRTIFSCTFIVVAFPLVTFFVPQCEAREALPSDVSIQLSAEPSTGLEPGEPFTLTVAVSNLGPSPIDLVVFESSELAPDQLDISQSHPDCPIRLFVSDGTTGYFYLFAWMIGFEDDPPLAPFETRTCHLTFTLASTATQAVPIRFFLSNLYEDSNPSNDSSSIVLRRAAATIAPVPTTSIGALFALAIMLISVVAALRRSGR